MFKQLKQQASKVGKRVFDNVLPVNDAFSADENFFKGVISGSAGLMSLMGAGLIGSSVGVNGMLIAATGTAATVSGGLLVAAGVLTAIAALHFGRAAFKAGSGLLRKISGKSDETWNAEILKRRSVVHENPHRRRRSHDMVHSCSAEQGSLIDPDDRFDMIKIDPSEIGNFSINNYHDRTP